MEKPESTDHDHSRSVVTERYKFGLEDRGSNPDRIFYDGGDLTHLDLNLVVLSTEPAEHPRHWKKGKKWVVTGLNGFYCFLAPFSSTIFAPSLSSMMADLGEDREILGAIQIAIFLLSFAIAPIFLAPLSEIFGRRVVLRTGNAVFCVFSLGCGFCQTTAQLAVCRFLAGAGGSAALAVLGGVLADMWNLAERGRASGILGMAVVMGPVLGPTCGGWISERASWRWTCWVPAIAAAVLEIVAQFCLHESYIPALLRWKAARERKNQSNPALYTVLDLDSNNREKKATVAVLVEASRPVVYLFLDPALLILSLYFAFIFGVLYLVIASFHIVFGDGYGHSQGIVGVDLIAEGLGAMVGVVATTKLLEIVYKKQDKTKYRSESRLLTAFAGALLASAGLFIYGFTALKTHFIVPLIGIALFGAGSSNIFLAMQVYIIDSFDFPASAISGLSVLRCLFAGVFPLFGEQLFISLGVNWGVGLLAFMSLGLGVPFLPMVYVWGPKLREIGRKNWLRFGL